MEREGKQAGWSKVLENGKITPRGREREASRLEQSVRKREDDFKRKRKGSKQVREETGLVVGGDIFEK